jgi:hypothetical protein
VEKRERPNQEDDYVCPTCSCHFSSMYAYQKHIKYTVIKSILVKPKPTPTPTPTPINIDLSIEELQEKLTESTRQLTEMTEKYNTLKENLQRRIYAPKKKIIEELIENKRSLLQQYVDDNGDKYGEKILRRYQNYVDALDDEHDTEEKKDLEIEIICMLLNVSEVVGSDDWSKKLLEDLKHVDDTQ